MYRSCLIFGAVLLLLAACATPANTGPKVHIEGAWARPMDAGSMVETSGTPEMQDMPGMSGSEMNSAVYFVIVNDGGEMDTLVGVASEVAASAQVHETRIDNDIAQMVPISHVDIPAYGRIEFKPLGYHMMLVGLTQDLKEGESIKITFFFKKSGTITLDVPIRQEQ